MQIQPQHETLHSAVLPAQTSSAPQSGKAAPTKNSSGATSSDTTSTSITANDFLSLLVAEMKNQDPTSTQDPNAYIDQLVQVNSLQQLIQINQHLGSTSANTNATSDQRSAGTGRVIGAASNLATALAPKPDGDGQLTRGESARTERVASAAARVRGQVNAR